MKSKKSQETANEEAYALFRYACERLARSMYVKALPSTIKILAYKMETAALAQIEFELDMKRKYPDGTTEVAS